MKTLSSNCFFPILCGLLSVIYIKHHQPFLSIIPCKVQFANFSSHFRKQKSQIKRQGEQGSFAAYVVIA